MRVDDYDPFAPSAFDLKVNDLERELSLMRKRVDAISDALETCAMAFAPEMANAARELREREADKTWKYGGDGTPKCRHCGKEWMAMPAAKYCPFCGHRNSWVKKNGHS